jgi:hypothetical protein
MTERERTRRGPLVVAGISVLWFAGTLWFTHAAALNAADPSIALIDAALALPLLIAAGLVAGAAVGVVVVTRLLSSGRIERTRWAVLAGAGAGLVLGGVAGGLVLLAYGTAPSLVSLAIAMTVAAAAGGAAGGVPWPAVVVAGVVGSLVRFGLGLVEGLSRSVARCEGGEDSGHGPAATKLCLLSDARSPSSRTTPSHRRRG